MRQNKGASQANGLGSAKAPEPFGLGPTGAIPSAEDARLQRRQFSFGEGRERPKSISKTHRKLLRSFTDPIHARIEAMPDDELWQFIEAGQAVSMTNCGWDEYAVAKTYLEGAQWLMKERLASAGEAGTATTTKIGVVHEHAIGSVADETPNPYLSPQGSKL